MDYEPRKSKAGLIAAIVAVLVVAGGTAGYLAWSSGKGQPVIASNEDAGGTTDPDHEGTSDASGDPANQTDSGQQGNSHDPLPVDAGSPGESADAGAKDPDNTIVIPPPEAKPVVVVIQSQPKKATVKLDGVLVGVTPVKVKVTPGENMTFTVSKSRYRDSDVVVDGSQSRVEVKLDKRPRDDNTSSKDAGVGNTNNKRDGTGSLDIPLE